VADLLLSGILNLKGDLNLVGESGGRVKVNNLELLVETPRGEAGKSHGVAAAPVLIPPPPAAPSEPGLDVWIFKSFNATVKADSANIITQGLCGQGNPGTATWPGVVQPSTNNPGLTINNIPINVLGDMGIILPTGAPVPFTASGQ
jgi:hypothetical protein